MSEEYAVPTQYAYDSTFRYLQEILWGKCKQDPEMVFSVIGDSDTFVPKPWPKSVFEIAIMDAASSAGACSIVYHGGENVISEMIKRAYEGFRTLSNNASNGIELLEVRNDTKTVYIQRYMYQKMREQDNSDRENRGKGNRGRENEGQGNRASENKGQSNRARGNKVQGNKARENKGQSDRAQENERHGERLLEHTSDSDFQRYLLNLEINITNLTSSNAIVSKTESSRGEKYKLKYMRIPLLLVVVEGDLDTIKHVRRALCNALPVLIIKGSGKAADLIVDYLNDETVLESKAAVMFGQSFNRNDFKKLERHMEKIKTRESLISVFDVNNDDPQKMSYLAGDVVIRAWSLSHVVEHKHKLRNRKKSRKYERRLGSHTGHRKSQRTESVAAANTETDNVFVSNKLPQFTHFTPSKYTSPTSFPLYFYLQYQHIGQNLESEFSKNLFYSALLANRHDYVEVLLDRGLRLPAEKLRELYQETLCECFTDKTCCFHVGWFVESISKCMESILKNENVSKTTNKIVGRILGYKKKNPCKNRKSRVQDEVADNEHDGKNPCKNRKSKVQDEVADNEHDDTMNLLLWSLIMNRKEIAFTLWRRTKCPLLTALMSTVILRKLQKRAAVMNEYQLCSDMQVLADFFENRGLLLMDEMYEVDQKSAIKLIQAPGNVWGINETNPLSFAHQHRMYDVVAHPCSQKNLNKRWYNDLPHGFLYVIEKGFFKEMISAPLTKFIIQQFIFLLVLITLSYFVLTGIDSAPWEFSRSTFMELFCFAWFTIDFGQFCKTALDEYRGRGKSNFVFHIGMWKKIMNFWNPVEALAYIVFILGFLMRRVPDLEASRRLYSFATIFMYIRLLQMLLMNRVLGPLMIMFKEMLKDLFQFLMIAFIIVTGVGIYYHANMWPNHPHLFFGSIEDWRIWDILYYPYWQLYGEGFNEFLEGRDQSDCSSDRKLWAFDTSIHRCPAKDWTMPIVTAMYMMVSNLLLVNLVIAMFSHTFVKVKADAERLWRYERYRVITDFESRYPTPFNLLWFLLEPNYPRCHKQQQDPSSEPGIDISQTLARRQTLKSERKKNERMT